MKTFQDFFNEHTTLEELTKQKQALGEAVDEHNDPVLCGLLRFVDACLDETKDEQRLKCPQCGRDGVVDFNSNNQLLYCQSCLFVVGKKDK